MAPAIAINNIDISPDFDKSEIDFKPFEDLDLAKRSSCHHKEDLLGMGGKIKEKFKEEILKEIIAETKQYIQTTFEKEINQELFDYGTHYEIGDGVGLDFSLT